MRDEHAKEVISLAKEVTARAAPQGEEPKTKLIAAAASEPDTSSQDRKLTRTSPSDERSVRSIGDEVYTAATMSTPKVATLSADSKTATTTLPMASLRLHHDGRKRKRDQSSNTTSDDVDRETVEGADSKVYSKRVRV